MNALKKVLGIIWMLLAPSIVCFLLWQASEKVGQATVLTRSNVTLQWVIILLIFIPVCIGLLIFGFYSFKGFYNQVQQNPAETFRS